MAKFDGDKESERALGAYANLVRATASVDALLRRQLDLFGLTMSQFRVLETLRLLGPMIQAALCERLFTDHGNMNFVVGNLRKRGLVGRRACQSDGRSKSIHLTPEGRKLIERVFPSHARLVRAQMDAVTNREQEALRRICGKLGCGDPVRITMWFATTDAGEDGESSSKFVVES